MIGCAGEVAIIEREQHEERLAFERSPSLSQQVHSAPEFERVGLVFLRKRTLRITDQE